MQCSKDRGRHPSLDHLVGRSEESRWYGKAKRPCSLEIDGELQLGRKFDRKISWLYPLQDFVHEIGGAAGIRNQTRAITDEFTSAYLLALACDRRQACGKRQFRNPRSGTDQNGVARHDHSLTS